MNDASGPGGAPEGEVAGRAPATAAAAASAGAAPGSRLTAPKPPNRTRKLIFAVVALVVIVFVFVFALPRFASYKDAFEAIGKMTWWQVAILTAVALVKVALGAAQQQAGLPGLDYGTAWSMSTSATAVSNTVPAGGAIGLGIYIEMLHKRFSPTAIADLLVVTGVWNDLMKLVLPVAAGFVLLFSGSKSVAGVSVIDLFLIALAALAVLVLVVALFAAIIRNEEFARRIGRFAQRVASKALSWVHRPGVQHWDDVMARFTDNTGHLVKERWVRLTVVTTAGELSMFVILVLSARFVGIEGSELNVAQIFAAWVLIRLLQLLPLTPGGLGIVQLGLTGALTVAGAPKAEAVAATLVYTFMTWLPPIIVGPPSWLVWKSLDAKHQHQARADTADALAPGAAR